MLCSLAQTCFSNTCLLSSVIFISSPSFSTMRRWTVNSQTFPCELMTSVSAWYDICRWLGVKNQESISHLYSGFQVIMEKKKKYFQTFRHTQISPNSQFVLLASFLNPKRYLHAQEKPYALHPFSEKVLPMLPLKKLQPAALYNLDNYTQRHTTTLKNLGPLQLPLLT